MKRSIRNIIPAILIGAAILVAGFSSHASAGTHKGNFDDFCMHRPTKNFSADGNIKRDSEFWAKFRDSVMPDEKDPSANIPSKFGDKPDQSGKDSARSRAK